MKKILMILSAAVLLFTGCAKENSEFGGEGNLVNVTFSANVKSAPTRAAIDNDGKGANANRCIMELWYANKVYGRYEAAVTGYQATFNVTVPAKRTYKVVLWADCATDNDDGTFTDLYYNTSENLANITLDSAYVGNDDARDAFYYSGEQEVTVQGGSFNATLTRPFAQINVITTDVQDIKMVELYPEKVNLAFKAATSFNAVDGTCGELEDIEYEASVYKAYDESKSELTLSMDYLFASDERSTVDIAFVAPTDSTFEVEHEFSNIPYQRNYRTNIKGALLTTTGQWTVTIKPVWNTPDENISVYEAGSIAAANEALKTNNAVKIENPSDLGTPIVIPAEQDGKNVLIAITGATTGDIVVKQTGEGPATLGIESDSKNLNIDLPKSHVELNKGNFTGVKANTSATTLVVGKEVKIETLTIDGGNAEIYGLVSAISRANGVKANWYADNRAKLIAGLDKSIAGESVVLTSDIDLNNVDWAPVTIGKAITFDGDNHTIKNLSIAGTYPDSHYGLIGYLHSNGVIKNLTIDGAQILLPESKGDNSRGAALVGIARDGDIINCHVKNVTVKAYQKVGGLIGQYSLEASGTSIVKDCSADSVIISENQTGEGVWGAGGLIGSLCFVNSGHSIEVEGCSVKGISIANSTTVAKPKQTAHAFIGTIRDDAEGAVATLTGNTVEQTPGLYTDMYSSEYFGWATNPESNPSHKCQIIIDGTPWTPNYPIVNENTGVKYPTIAKAVEGASEGDVINITAAGTYTVPGISKNITVAGDVDGVVFDCTGSGSIASIPNGATFQNVTMNFGQTSYHGFQHAGHIIMEGCILNGLFFSYGDMTFKGCTFNQENEEYNMWAYGNDITYDGCTFNSKGKFVNVYCERNATAYNIVAKDCVFNTSNANKAALNIKETCGTTFLKYNVTIENCSCNERQNTLENKDDGTLYRVSPIWQVDDRKDGTTGINVTIDGVKVYPFYSQDANGNFHVANVKGLFEIAKDINKSVDKFYYKTIYLDADIDLANAAWTPIVGGVSGDFDFDFDGQNHVIKNVAINANGSSNAAFFGNWAGDIKNLTLNTIAVTDGDKRTAGLVGQMATGTIENCHVINATIKSGNYKVGGMVGSVTADPCTIKGCSVKNSSIEGLEQVGGFCGSLGTGDGGVTKFIDNVVENITITSSNSASAKANTFGAYVGTYFVEGYVAENTNNAISGTNDIYSANEGFGILLKQ